MKPYYYITIWRLIPASDGNPATWVPRAAVSDKHPAEVAKDLRRRDTDAVITGWQLITEGEYQAFLEWMS